VASSLAIRLAFAAIVLCLLRPELAHADSLETCRAGHICVSLKDYENRQSGNADGGAYGCAIRYRGRGEGQDRELFVTLIAGEGTVLPYLIFEIYLRGAEKDGKAGDVLAPRRGWVSGANNTILTRGWETAVRNGVLTIRSDVLPEDRSQISQFAALVTSDNHLFVLEIAAGTYSQYFIAPAGEQRQVAETFIDCVSKTHANVRSMVPAFR
jgi:hypothetical protein